MVVSCVRMVQAALGPCGTHRGRTWCPLTGQQCSSVMCSVWCHSSGRRRSRRLVWNTLTPSPGARFFSHLPLRDAADLDISCARRKRTELNQLSLRGAGGFPPQSSACILDHISGSYLFSGLGGSGCGGSCPAHQLLLDRPTMVALQWSSWPARVHAPAGHHESRKC